MSNFSRFSTIVKDGNGFSTIRYEEQYHDPYTQVNREYVRTPTRPDGQEWTVIHRKAATVVAPLTEDGEFVLVCQDRIPVRRSLWEFPAGQIDQQGETTDSVIRETAIRELAEETGFGQIAEAELIPLGHFFTSPGFTDEHAFLFLAKGVKKLDQGIQPDSAETIHEVRLISREEVWQWVREGKICDANTLTTLARLTAFGY